MQPFDLVMARDLPGLLNLAAEKPGAWLVAGATDFIPFVRAGRWQPSLAIDISRIDALHYLGIADGYLECGPLVTHAELAASTELRQAVPALAQAAASVADPQIRARATVGGNICTASPAADTVPALLVLDAELRLLSSRGERHLLLEDFLLGPGRTDLAPGEILAGIRCRLPGRAAGSAFVKLGRRSAMAVSVLNAAAMLATSGDGTITAARLAVGAAAPTVVRCRAAERALAGCPGDVEALRAAAALVSSAIRPIDDVRSSAAYRGAVAPVLAQRALERAWAAARGQR